MSVTKAVCFIYLTIHAYCLFTDLYKTIICRITTKSGELVHDIDVVVVDCLLTESFTVFA